MLRKQIEAEISKNSRKQQSREKRNFVSKYVSSATTGGENVPLGIRRAEEGIIASLMRDNELCKRLSEQFINDFFVSASNKKICLAVFNTINSSTQFSESLLNELLSPDEMSKIAYISDHYDEIPLGYRELDELLSKLRINSESKTLHEKAVNSNDELLRLQQELSKKE